MEDNALEIAEGDTLVVAIDKHGAPTDELGVRTARLYVIKRRAAACICLASLTDRLSIHTEFTLERAHARALDVDTRWLGETVVVVADPCVRRILKTSDGCACDSCGTWRHMASRTSDGKFVCYACKQRSALYE